MATELSTSVSHGAVAPRGVILLITASLHNGNKIVNGDRTLLVFYLFHDRNRTRSTVVSGNRNE